MKKISVIIPVYNAQQYLSECLNSILNQTYKNLEIILIDDGSTDDSLKICRIYAKQDNRIRVLHQKNNGSTHARRTGLSIASGEYISFVDSDDWIDSCFYEKLYELAEENQADLVVSGCVTEKDKMVSLKKNNISEGLYDEQSLKEVFYPQMLCFESAGFFEFGIQQYLWNKLYRKSVIQPCIENLDARIYDGEDVACVFEACLRAKSIVVDNHCWYHYRIHENSICTSQKDERYFINAVYLYNYMERVFSDSGEKEILLPQLKHFIRFFINNGMKNVFDCMYTKARPSEICALPEILVSDSCRLALYGSGKAGISCYRQLLSLEKAELVSWVDSFAYGGKIGGVQIEPPEVLLDREWDYVLIAVKNEEKCKEIKKWLRQHGVKTERILNIEPAKVSQTYEFWEQV